MYYYCSTARTSPAIYFIRPNRTRYKKRSHFAHFKTHNIIIADAHRGRGRRRIRIHGRVQPPQARPRARAAPVHRRHDHQRVPQVHREGQGARAAISAGVHRRAQSRGHREHPEGTEAQVRAAPRGEDSRRGAAGRGEAQQPVPARSVLAGQG